MKPSHLLMLALFSLAFFELIMISFQADYYNNVTKCDSQFDRNIPECGFTLQKIIILTISASATMIFILLSLVFKEVVYLLNFIIALVSVLSVFIYMFGIVGNDGYKDIPDFIKDKTYYRERYFPPIMEELAITVTVTSLSFMLYSGKKGNQGYEAI